MDKEIENIVYLEGISQIMEHNEEKLISYEAELKKLSSDLKRLKILLVFIMIWFFITTILAIAGWFL